MAVAVVVAVAVAVALAAAVAGCGTLSCYIKFFPQNVISHYRNTLSYYIILLPAGCH